MLCRICVVQIQSKKHVPDLCTTDYTTTAPTLHELWIIQIIQIIQIMQITQIIQIIQIIQNFSRW